MPTMRDTHVCPACRHNRIIHIAQISDEDEGGTRPANIAMTRNPQPGFFAPTWIRAGRLSAYVCRKCGFVEHYVLDPQNIPIDGKFATELVGPASEPYR
jgi:hypothetical protein